VPALPIPIALAYRTPSFRDEAAPDPGHHNRNFGLAAP
jgi:hypothetical protein